MGRSPTQKWEMVRLPGKVDVSSDVPTGSSRVGGVGEESIRKHTFKFVQRSNQ